MSMEKLATEGQSSETLDWFKEQNLQMLRGELQGLRYRGYPYEKLTIENGATLPQGFNAAYLPPGPWQVMDTRVESIDGDMVSDFRQKDYKLDSLNRPLHPWIHDLLQPAIGVRTGRGAYWNWGANRTADPVIVRHDLAEPKILLITRGDTGRLALPGGFVEGKDNAYETAVREAAEEAFLDIGRIAGREVYCGPLSDVRMTANAWPETTAYVFELPDDISRQLPDASYEAGDDAKEAHWLTYEETQERVLGPHRLLIELAFRDL